MHNHYISQFVIKRFSGAINIFNIDSGEIDEKKRPHKVFFKEDIYDEETERLFNYIESRVANILDNKILKHDRIIITRKELLLLKRYMLICSVRTMTPDGFGNILRGFEENAKRYISVHNLIYSDIRPLPYIKDMEIDNEQLYSRSIKVFSTAEQILDVALNPNATAEMLAWAAPFLEAYLAFWDMPTGKEYVLTDCGMSSEYEGFHLITGGIDISKISFLLNRLKKCPGYTATYVSQFAMYENYDIFVLSSDRAMVMINPFFRLYHGQEVLMYGKNGSEGERRILDAPDIWPAIIQNRSLFGIPENQYSISPVHLCEEDRFIYNPKVLSSEDAVYINTLLLSQSKEIIGFNDPRKIIDSIYYFVWYEGNYTSVTALNDSREMILKRLIDNVAKSKFRQLCDYCDANGGINTTEFIFLFEKLTSNIFKDFYSNPYISAYYLAIPDEAVNCRALDFLGEGEKRLSVFREILERIKNKRGTDRV